MTYLGETIIPHMHSLKTWILPPKKRLRLGSTIKQLGLPYSSKQLFWKYGAN
jgi:hypothetical protein